MSKVVNKSTKEERVTVRTYLNSVMTTKLSLLLTNMFLENVKIDYFFKFFKDRVQKDVKSVSDFILNSDNAYELALFGYRVSGLSKYYGYNGKGIYQGTKCTIGVSHSRFHG